MRSDSPDSEDLNDPQFLEIYQSAMDLYGVIHARYILSPHGLNKMREKFLQGAFGTCPRVLCERQHVLPIGVSEELSTSRVKVYCPRCVDVYLPRQKQLDIDGAYFGASFPHVFLKVSSFFLSSKLILCSITMTKSCPRLDSFPRFTGSRFLEWEAAAMSSNLTMLASQKMKVRFAKF